MRVAARVSLLFAVAQVSCATSSSSLMLSSNLGRAYFAVQSGASAAARSDHFYVQASADGIIVTNTQAKKLAVDDELVTQSVRNVINADSDLRQQRLQVATAKGEVSLTGDVASVTMAGEAIRDALCVDGVNVAHVFLQLRPLP